MNAAAENLLGILTAPERMAALSSEAWDLVLRQAVNAGLGGRLGALALSNGTLNQLDPAVQHHLTVWHQASLQQRRSVHWELTHLTRDLADLPGPVLLLKGAAYVAADLAPAPGRLFSDIDLMVPQEQLGNAEAALMLGGWQTNKLSNYDLNYYRQWTHELPPMRHLRRLTVLDLHHSILPITARIKTRPDLILAGARQLAAFPRFSVPAPCDLVLHSATHLFHEGDWQHALRDLVDLDALLRQYSADAGFWSNLLERAEELNLGRPLYYALRCCQRLLQTPIPDGVVKLCPRRPSAIHGKLMEALFVAAIGTAHSTMRTPTTGAAEFALYVRSHWLRMPLHLLLPHLMYKAWQDHAEPLFARKPGDAMAQTKP